MENGHLLSNLRVLEVADGWVGPWAGGLLADLGAEVIKVESINRMDMTRGPGAVPITDGAVFYHTYPEGKLGEKPWNRNSQFNIANFGKYSVTLDLTNPDGLKVFFTIAKTCDVFLSNLAVGSAEKLGITFEDIAKIKTNIIYLSATGFGRTGPYAKRVAMGSTIDAAAGLFGLRDYGDGDSTAVSPDVHCDSLSGLTNALAILMALYYRDKTGSGTFIDLSMVEASMIHIGEAIMDYTMNGRIEHSRGNRDLSMSQGCYRCKGIDAWVTLSISTDEEWVRLAGLMNSQSKVQEPRFQTVPGRLQHQDELDRLIEEWTIQHDKFDIMNILQAANIPAGAVLNNAEVYNNQHLKERKFFKTIEDVDAGRHLYPGRLWNLICTDTPERRHSPSLGEHNNYVLKEIAKLADKEIMDFERAGIIGTRPV